MDSGGDHGNRTHAAGTSPCLPSWLDHLASAVSRAAAYASPTLGEAHQGGLTSLTRGQRVLRRILCGQPGCELSLNNADEVNWHAWLDSNQRPPASEAGALFPELQAYLWLPLRDSNTGPFDYRSNALPPELSGNRLEGGLGFEPRTSGVRVRRNCPLCYPPIDSSGASPWYRATLFWSSVRRFHLISLGCNVNISPRPRRIARRLSETADRTQRCGGDPETSVRRAACGARNRRFLSHRLR